MWMRSAILATLNLNREMTESIISEKFVYEFARVPSTELQHYVIATSGICHFPMFDPSVGTLKGLSPKNEVDSDVPFGKGFPTTYHSSKSVLRPYNGIKPDVLRSSSTFARLIGVKIAF